ncbi:MAG: nuclear transport factor 2 family protein [Myxococcota bacterium]
MKPVVCGLLLALATGCAHSKIRNTDIDDTSENREVLKFVEEYKSAVESLDADAVLALVDPSFYEDNGNTDSSDDYDYEGLKTHLRESFERTKAMQLILRVDAVEVERDEAFAELYYEFRAHNEYPSGEKWNTGTDRTRLRLIRSGKDQPWRIAAGL